MTVPLVFIQPADRGFYLELRLGSAQYVVHGTLNELEGLAESIIEAVVTQRTTRDSARTAAGLRPLGLNDG